MRNILNAATKTGKFNILTCPTHEAYQSNLSDVNADFYLFQSEGIKTWETKYRPLPKNHYLLPKDYFPYGIDFDLVLNQNKLCQYQKLATIAQSLKIPIINLEHCLPPPNFSIELIKRVEQMPGIINCYISDYSAKKWLAEKQLVIPHCIDTETFAEGTEERQEVVLTVANDYINRDYCLNFKQYQNVTKGLPTFPVGDTPGFSKAAESIEQLVSFYQKSQVFLNTAHWSPIPMSLLEAMSCGCACVSIDACAIPEYIEHGVNGFLAKTDHEMREYLGLLLYDKNIAAEIGKNAAKTIREKCSKEKFTENWNNLFRGIYANQTVARKQ